MTKLMTLKEWIVKEGITAYRLAMLVEETPQRIYATLNGSVPHGNYREKLKNITRGEVDFLPVPSETEIA
jgi:hypothetical protein